MWAHPKMMLYFVCDCDLQPNRATHCAPALAYFTIMWYKCST